jgi:PTS system N-acetylglucosamine-specific IIA component
VIRVGSPLPGRVVGLSGVPDPVFAEAIVGPGTAIDPPRLPTTAVAPLDGRIAKLHPHAFVLVGGDGRGVLVHLGIDTVQLAGEGFELLAHEGDDVHRGQPLVRWDPAAVERSGRSPICPVVALDATPEMLSDVIDSGEVAALDPLFTWGG